MPAPLRATLPLPLPENASVHGAFVTRRLTVPARLRLGRAGRSTSTRPHARRARRSRSCCCCTGSTRRRPRSSSATARHAFSEAEHFTLVYPIGEHEAWNAGTCCRSDTANDVGYLVDLVHYVATLTPVDLHRVYVWGFSNGGMMAWRAVCQTHDVFAGAGVMAGALLVKCPGPVHVVDVHGLRDTTVPYDGGYSRYTHTVMPDSAHERRELAPGSTLDVVLLKRLGHEWPPLQRKVRRVERDLAGPARLPCGSSGDGGDGAHRRVGRWHGSLTGAACPSMWGRHRIRGLGAPPGAGRRGHRPPGARGAGYRRVAIRLAALAAYDGRGLASRAAADGRRAPRRPAPGRRAQPRRLGGARRDPRRQSATTSASRPSPRAGDDRDDAGRARRTAAADPGRSAARRPSPAGLRRLAAGGRRPADRGARSAAAAGYAAVGLDGAALRGPQRLGNGRLTPTSPSWPAGAAPKEPACCW